MKRLLLDIFYIILFCIIWYSAIRIWYWYDAKNGPNILFQKKPNIDSLEAAIQDLPKDVKFLIFQLTGCGLIFYFIFYFSSFIATVIQLVLICGLIFFTVLWYFDSFDPQWLVSSFFSVTRILINAVTNISIDLNIDFAQMTTNVISFCYATKEAGYQFGVGCADSSIYLYELFRHIFSKRFIFSVARRGLLSTSNYLLGLANQIPVLDESENHFEGSGEELPNVIL